MVPVERFKWYGISLLWQMVPIERFRRNRMVFELRFVPLERFRWYKTIIGWGYSVPHSIIVLSGNHETPFTTLRAIC